MNGLFVTGTDTGIGKTVLSSLLLAELRRRGIHAAPMKPVQTGCVKLDPENPGADRSSGIRHRSFSSPDLDYSLSMAQMRVSGEDYTNMCPYCFETACSPHLAAELAGAEIDINKIVIAAQSMIVTYEFIVAEGAGGILVPLNRRETMLDLMRTLNFPVLVAARPNLGTLNHTLLSIRALRAEGLRIAGIVIIQSEPLKTGFIEEDNRTTVEQFGTVPILGEIPYCEQLQEEKVNYTSLPISVIAETEKIVNKLSL